MSAHPQRIGVVTGSRAEFGLLEPIMRAVAARGGLDLRVIVAGAHFLAPEETHRLVAERFDISASVAMQRDGETGRLADARAVGRGILGFAEAFERLACDWIVVLGDRIEAFAAASAGSVAGVPIAHLHGGDRAEGVADEAMRHAISKLAHLHLPATEQSAERLRRMGEPDERIRIVGSPAVDALASIEAMSDEQARGWGDPEAVVLLHPVGDAPEIERERAEALLAATRSMRTLALHPNHDPGREGVLEAIEADASRRDDLRVESHVPREMFLALLARLAARHGVVVGNSSAGLIECAAVGLAAVDVGERQGGRERPNSVVHVPVFEREAIESALRDARSIDRGAIVHPYGDGRTGERVAEALVAFDASGGRERRVLLRKRNAY